MKNIFFLLMALNLFAQDTTLNDIINWYNDKNFKKVCSNIVTSKYYYKYNSNEEFINMYAHSCLQTDMINRLSLPIIHLRKTKQSRANALYYTTVLYQKKLLHHAVVDGLEWVPRDLPSTNYILSYIYDKYAKKDYKKVDEIYYFDENMPISYKMRTRHDSDGFTKLVLESYKDGKKIKTRLYW